ncbi:hypothetical protein N658DRAFT_563052 [Parathielavia hyrcaniae]|uniref:Uncharacterized protein n=1 Tax=Parathielavia hyrcaniae TaxID=113614 RepID=A0AAN6QES4_9PEZI|nr:hypothetical protein N658DRAFT_563052 [Parathielavia hyrcaniae]
MRPSILSRLLRRHTPTTKLRPPRPHQTSSSSSLLLHDDANSKPTTPHTQPFNAETYLASARQKFTSQPPTIIPDILSPTHSHLLTLSLADHVPSLFPASPPSAGDNSNELLPRLCLPPGDPLSKESLSVPDPIAQPNPNPNPNPDKIMTTTPPPPLPQGYHLVYFPLKLPPSRLMPDGTDPAHWPGAPFARRMWAGGRVVFREGWRESMRLDGRRAICVERVVPESLEVMQGGRLGGGGEQGVGMEIGEERERERVFVEVQRLYGVVPAGAGGGGGRVTDEEVGRGLLEGRGVAVEEVRRLVFMRERTGLVRGGGGGGVVGRKIVKASAVPEFTFPLKPDNTLLFHFSALTYNAHAIHLDPHYARYHEGYPGLLVHGPLTLVLMLEALRAALVRLQSQTPATPEQAGRMPSVKSITYRNLAPLFSNEDMKVCLRKTRPKGDDLGWDMWVEGPEGGIAVKGHAVTTGLVPPS